MARRPGCWSVSGLSVMASYFGMRGLSNYCMSCCANTLLQTLSATWELAALLDRWEAGGVTASGSNVPLQLKKVLAAMKSSRAQPAPHHHFLRCLDTHRFRLHVQHDADEVFLSILDLIQQQMDDKPLALEIQNLYKISLETWLQCLECDSVQTHSSYQLNLPLHIDEDHNSLEGCLASFFQHQELRSMNCCFCPNCETKTPSKRGVKVASLPRVLCVNLKRFRNSRFGSTRKLDCTVTFPETFDFSQMAGEVFSPGFVPNQCRYTLFAVVVHSGGAMCGHYTAYVRHVRHGVKQRWHYADDSCVREVSWEQVKTTYGGRHRDDTAYMLMYRREEDEEQQRAEPSRERT